MSDTLRVQDGLVVSMDYTLHIDGELIDSSDGHEPLDYLHGASNIIPGLEDELTGMAAGETKSVIVAPEDGYGILDPDAFMDVPRDQFPEEIPMEIGVQLQLQDESGEPMMARIDHISDDAVRLDFNHPLAGKELHFEVTIVAMREATEEEMDHGHPHGPHGH